MSLNASNYVIRYAKIYFWQVISLFTNLVSMFVVLPFLSENEHIFGIYSIVISLSLFFSYADLGFIYSAQKYGAEYLVRGDKEGELKIVGFSSFITGLVLIIISTGLFLLSLNPEMIMNESFKNDNDYSITVNLLRLVSFSALLTIPMKICHLIFTIRMEDFIFQRFNVIANVIRLVSVYFLFNNGNYLIVEYFFLIQILSFLVIVSCFIYIVKRYNFKIGEILKSVRYQKDSFNKSKSLAASGFYLTMVWISYYELDQIIIGKSLGALAVARYAIGLSLLSFIRGLFGIIYTPFNQRFNYFTGVSDFAGLRGYYKTTVIRLSPIIIGFIFCVVLNLNSLVVNWVGEAYIDSIHIAAVLVLCNLFAFVNYPTSMLLKSLEELRTFNIFNTFMPIVFFFIIYFWIDSYQEVVVAYAKLAVFHLLSLYYLYIYKKYTSGTFLEIFKDLFLPNFIPALSVCTMYYLLYSFIPLQKSAINLAVSITFIALSFVVYLVTYILVNKDARVYFAERFYILKGAVQ